MELLALSPYFARNLKTQTLKERKMKLIKVILIVLAFTNLAQANTTPVSAQKVANLFVNPQVMGCMAEVTKYNNKAELYAGEVTQEIIGTDKIGQIAKTSIHYTLITGGDIVAGNIEVIITEEKWKHGLGDF